MRFQLAFCLSLLAVTACKKKTPETETPATTTPQLKLAVQPVFGSENIVLDNGVYTTSDGSDVQFTDLKFYVTRLKNGSTQLVDAAKFDYREKGTTCFQVDGAVANFNALEGFIGVPSDLNHNDPSAFPNASVLNIANANDMHWDWNPGYIFIKIEARVDTIPDGTPLFDHYLTYHVGTDAYLGSVNFPSVNWTTSGNVSTTRWQLDLQQVLDNATNPINIRSEKTTHSGAGQEALTQKVLTNFLDALTAP